MDVESFNQPAPEQSSPSVTIPPLPTHLPDPYKTGMAFKSFQQHTMSLYNIQLLNIKTYPQVSLPLHTAVVGLDSILT